MAVAKAVSSNVTVAVVNIAVAVPTGVVAVQAVALVAITATVAPAVL